MTGEQGSLPSRGWGWPLNSRKAHYFVNGRSLCGRWLFFGKPDGTPASASSPDDCKACRRKLDQ